VLDIGCGQGYNAQELVRSGARLTAIDLTEKGLSLATQRFRLRGLHANFVQADAENLPFKNESFDFVHSSGAIHHTPHIQKAVDEIYRILRKGGRGSIMVYHKSSWVYWYRIQLRLRLLMTLLYLLPSNVRGHLLARKPRLAMYVPRRWPSSADILNAGTDVGGVENPLSRVFTRREATGLFARFTIEGFATSWGTYKPFKERKSALDRMASAVHNWIARRWGWYLLVYIRK